MRSTITLNGISSNTIQGLLIQSLPPISKPLMRTQIEEIDGRDGDVITKLGFSAYTKQITIGLHGNFDINQVISYFNSEGTVIFSNEPDKYYYYQILEQIDFERLIRFRTATVTMHVQPFKYSTTQGTEVFDNSSNLLTIPNFTKTTNGITVTVANNTISVSGTGTAATEFYIPIDTLSLSVGKYGMYALGSGTNPEACSLRVIYNSPSNANSFGGNYVTLQNNKTVSLLADLSNAKTYNYVYLYIAANQALNFTLNLSIEDAAQAVVSGEGSLITLENTAFAPFSKFNVKGDTKQEDSPTPSSPKPVQVVTGEQTVTITDGASESQEYNITLAKNYINFDQMSETTAYGVTVSFDAATFSLNGSTNNASSGILRATTGVTLEAGTYTVTVTKKSGNKSGTAAETAFYIRPNNGNAAATFSLNNVNAGTEKPKQITLSESSEIYIQLYANAIGQTYDNFVVEVKIKKDPIELCKIGNYQDYIYKSGDDWYVHKEIASRNLSENAATDNWNRGTDNGGRYYVNRGATYYGGAGGSSDKLCSHVSNDISDSPYFLLGNAQYFQFREASSTWATLDDFLSWLTSNSVIVYFPLATATNTKITDTDLISQLEALVTDAHAYRNTTTLVSTSEDLPHIMSVEVAKNNDATITNSGNTTARPVMTVYGSGTVGIYLNGNQIFTVNIGNNQYITIDTANMEAYKDTTNNLMNRLVDGDYSNFVLQTGANTISFSGTVSKLEISNYSRWI